MLLSMLPDITPETLSALFRRIDDARDELISLTQDLIRFPTINPPGDAYDACCRYLGQRFAERGAKVDYIRAFGAPDDSDTHPRMNVIARLSGEHPGPCIHFNGHIDVVEAGHGWTVDPFEGVVRDGRIYGRGTCDMKGGIASAILAMEALHDLGLITHGALEFSGTADEESGGFGGVGFLAREGWFAADRVDHVIIPEPLNPDRVCLGHRGVWWSEVEFRGRIGHGSMPFLGVSAISGAADFLNLIENELLPRLSNRFTSMPCMPEGARRATLNINSIHGGQPEPYNGRPAPVVADSARVVLDRRYLIEENIDDVKGEIMALLERVKAARAGIDFEIRDVMEFAPTMTPPDADVVQALDHWIYNLFGKPSQHIASPGTYDQKHITRLGAVRGCVAYGPGILDLAHQPDEWIGIEDMVIAAKVMAASALTLLRAGPKTA